MGLPTPIGSLISLFGVNRLHDEIVVVSNVHYYYNKKVWRRGGGERNFHTFVVLNRCPWGSSRSWGRPFTRIQSRPSRCAFRPLSTLCRITSTTSLSHISRQRPFVYVSFAFTATYVHFHLLSCFARSSCAHLAKLYTVRRKRSPSRRPGRLRG